VLNHFAEYQQKDVDSLEARGQLFARFSDHEIKIISVTGPRPADHRSRYLYLPNRREEHREIDEMHRKGLHFVGDWHTHPEDVLAPSPSDIRTIKEAVAKSRHHLHGLLMIVVGSGDFPTGLHVSLNTAACHLRLSPIIQSSCQFGNYLRIWPRHLKLNANGRTLFANGSPLHAIGSKWQLSLNLRMGTSFITLDANEGITLFAN
jgi:integrative and conjugative element protein (TIGR02256 family)